MVELKEQKNKPDATSGLLDYTSKLKLEVVDDATVSHFGDISKHIVRKVVAEKLRRSIAQSTNRTTRVITRCNVT